MSPLASLRPVLISLVVAASAASAQPAAVDTPQPGAEAQPAPGTVAAAAADPGRSAFEGYRRFDDVKLIPWQQANDTVRAVGGWRAYAKEAQEPAHAAGGPPNAPAGHHSHGEVPAR